MEKATFLSKSGAPCKVKYGDDELMFKTTKGKIYEVVLKKDHLKKL